MRDGLAEEISALECRLHEPDVRRDQKELEALLAEDFIEFASSGGIYRREQVIASLLTEEPVTFAASDFSARQLSDTNVLLTYRTTRAAGRGVLRSSLWQKQDGHWKMIFHQGTPQS